MLFRSCSLTASQAGDDYTYPADPVSFDISIVGSRVTDDQPDTITGFQVKAYYVVPSDGVDHQYDLNGFLRDVLTEGNTFLQNQLGLRYQIDSTDTGYDIQFLKSSFSRSYLQTNENISADLYREVGLNDKPSLNRKEYIFFVDVPDLLGGSACGYANRPGIIAVVALGDEKQTSGPSCTAAYGQFKR